MGLRDLEDVSGKVTSNKKFGKIYREDLEWYLSSEPVAAEVFANSAEDPTIRLLVDILRDVKNDEISGVGVSDDTQQEAEKAMESLMEKL